MKNAEFNSLMRRVSNGDMTAMVPVYEEFYKKLQIVAIRILKNKVAAEDAASQTITDLIQDALNGKVNSVKYVSGYLCTRCRNIALKIKEHNKIFVELDDDEEVKAPDLIESVIGNADLTRAIVKLKDIEKEIGLMFYVYGYKIREISQELNMSEGTVKWQISNIKEKISKYFT